MLSTLYHFGPDRVVTRRFAILTPGAVVATVSWLIVSGLFSIYTAAAGDANPTFAALGSTIILMMWMYLTSLCVLLGAEIEAMREAERQAAVDPSEPVTRTPVPGPGVLGAALLGLAAGAVLARRRQ
jgi:membrane protein